MGTFRRKVTTIIVVIALAITLPLLQSQAEARDHDVLVLGVHPYLPEDELIRRFTPLANYLSQALNRSVVIKISRTYESHIENVGNQHYDIAYLGPASYVNITRDYSKPFIIGRFQVNGKAYFNGYIVVRQDSSISTLQQLKNKRFAFGSPGSTMSYLVPKYMLQQAGVSLDDLAAYEFQGDHKNVALSVLLGEFDAGAVKEEIYFQYREQGLKQIAISPNIPEHLFVTRNNLPPALQQKIKEIFLTLAKSSEGLAAMQHIKHTVTGIEPTRDSDYDILRRILD